MRRLLRSLVRAGVHPALPYPDTRRVMLLNGVAVAGLVVLGVLGVVEAAARRPDALPWLHITAFVCSAAVLVLNARRRYGLARALAVAAYAGLPAVAGLASGEPLRGRYILMGLALASCYVFERRATVVAIFVMQAAVFTAVDMRSAPTLANGLRYAFFFGLIFVVIDVFRREGQRHHRLIEAQRQDLARAHDALAANAARLEAVSAVKDRVLSVLAHDLRSPLVSLSALLELSAEGVVEPDERPGLDADLRRRLRLVQDVLDDVLGWAQPLVRGTSALEGNADLDALVERAVAQAAPFAQDKGITLSFPAPSGLQSAVDDGQVLLVLRNLLSNAVKFTPEGGTVAIQVEAVDGRPVLRVRDNGLGMTDGQVAALFDGAAVRTTRGTDGESGTGLGLLLCHEFATRVGGRLDIASVPGAGTTVSVALPPARPAPPPAAQASAASGSRIALR